MRRLALLLALTACKTGSEAKPAGDELTVHGPVAPLPEEDLYKPTYDKADLDKAIASEGSAITAAEQHLAEVADTGDTDQLRTATYDLAVRRRYLASLELCAASGRACPPRLDEPAWSYDVEGDAPPKLDMNLRFDLDSWRKVSAELFGRACACRTVACVDSMFVAIDKLETRPMPDVQQDDQALTSVTRARECLYRLRGLRDTPRAVAD